ncbi:MAG: hypothetical protein IJH31_05190 [Erysipelotrichaceae bacterium]|nr:hypothetical protein [Erysipelotrichaceae bacterium]
MLNNVKKLISCIAILIIVCLFVTSNKVFANGECELDDFTPWYSNDTLPTVSGKYYLTDDIKLTEVQYITGDNDVSICLNGHTIRQTKANSEVVILNMNATLSIYDCKESGDLTSDYKAGMITGGGNSCIRLMDDTVNGALKGTTFNLYGGVISNNNSIEHGGALYLEGHGTFNMYGGLFTNNVSYKCGGAVYAREFSTVNLLGGAFRNNESNQDGGAVYLYTASKGLVDGTIFLNNVTVWDGGAIYAEAVDTYLEVNSGTFKYNKSKTSGGGAIAIFTQGTMLLNDADIEENEAVYGGGIWIRKAYATINNATIINNKANTSGGGVQAQGIDIPFQKTCLTLNNAYIADNEAPDGGGVFIGGTGKIYLNDGTIENNKANNGGGIYVGTLGYGLVSNLKIKNNEALEYGGGIYCMRGSKSFFNNIDVQNNKALSAGGIYVDDDFQIFDSNISNNSASEGVGGLYIASADYDGESYYSSIVKMGGNMYIYDNEGNNKNMLIDEESIVNLVSDGLSEDAKIGVNSNGDLLTKMLIGKYNYSKKGNEYIVTKGDLYKPMAKTNYVLVIGIIIVVLALITFFIRKIFIKKEVKA